MMLAHVGDVPVVIGGADDRANDAQGAAQPRGKVGSLWRRIHFAPPVFAAAPRLARCVLNSSKMRRYSSAHDDGRTNPWSSTGYGASSQFVLPSSMSRCVRRTMS